MKILGVGKNAAYQLVAENKFKSVRIGSSIRISKESFDKWLNENPVSYTHLLVMMYLVVVLMMTKMALIKMVMLVDL